MPQILDSPAWRLTSAIKENKMEEDSRLTKYILSPALSGVYISKNDLLAVAATCGYALQVQERKRMLKELFALVGGVDDFVKIVDAFISFIKYKTDFYDKVSDEYRAAKEVVEIFKQKSKDAVLELEKAKEEAALLA